MERIHRLNPLLEILRGSPRRVQKVLVQKDKVTGRAAEAIRIARESGIPLAFVPREKLDRLAPGHQGIAAILTPKEMSSVDDLLASKPAPFLVLLDEIEDPQNLGAIIRSAEGAGADGIILPERRSAQVTETVLSVSSGAAAHVKVARVTNLVRTMEELKRRGLWLAGADAAARRPWFEFDYTIPVGIVLGSEGRGLRRLVREHCDELLSIPLAGRVNSLNVAAAAAVFFFEVVRQRSRRPNE